jgi:hypothetical protein
LYWRQEKRSSTKPNHQDALSHLSFKMQAPCTISAPLIHPTSRLVRIKAMTAEAASVLRRDDEVKNSSFMMALHAKVPAPAAQPLLNEQG